MFSVPKDLRSGTLSWHVTWQRYKIWLTGAMYSLKKLCYYWKKSSVQTVKGTNWKKFLFHAGYKILSIKSTKLPPKRMWVSILLMYRISSGHCTWAKIIRNINTDRKEVSRWWRFMGWPAQKETGISYCSRKGSTAVEHTSTGKTSKMWEVISLALV